MVKELKGLTPKNTIRGVADFEDYLSVLGDIEDEDYVDDNMVAVLYKHSNFETLGLGVLQEIIKYVAPKKGYQDSYTDYKDTPDKDFIHRMEIELGKEGYDKRLEELAKVYTLKNTQKIKGKSSLASKYMCGRVWIHKVSRMAEANGLKATDYENWMNTYGNLYKDEMLKGTDSESLEYTEDLIHRNFSGYTIEWERS